MEMLSISVWMHSPSAVMSSDGGGLYLAVTASVAEAEIGRRTWYRNCERWTV